MKARNIIWVLVLGFSSCKKKNDPIPVEPPFITPLTLLASYLDNQSLNAVTYGAGVMPSIKLQFSVPLQTASVAAAITLSDGSSGLTNFNTSFQNGDSVIVLTPLVALKYLTKYDLSIGNSLKAVSGGNLTGTIDKFFYTGIDSTDKFPRITDSALLDLIQKQTFKYFWDFGHPQSGMARERTSSNDIVTTGGTGFGIMAMLAATERNFITRADALSRVLKIVNFLSGSTTRYHGAFSHWINGATGATVPFGTQDDGGDIVETSYLLQGLLCARQYFNSILDNNELNLRTQINALYAAVEWNWYRQGNQNVLYWNWSPNYNWAINVKVGGWNEALITYVLAAATPTDSNRIPSIVYDNGWALNGNMLNGKLFYGVPLPLGPDYGGPLFFAHYSFLGINPHSLKDKYADYWVQDTAQSTINYLYCVNNPKGNFGYSSQCWGLTASDIPNGYTASSPTNDVGVIAPTAAISSLPYTPVQSMNAIRFFYYTLGDKIWGTYGFTDAFSLHALWYGPDCLAIDQGPEIVMIENYRSGLLWNLFMSCPEVKNGMKNVLQFSSPNL